MVGCLYTRYNLLFNRLSNRFDNRIDNRLYRVNGAEAFNVNTSSSLRIENQGAHLYVVVTIDLLLVACFCDKAGRRRVGDALESIGRVHVSKRRLSQAVSAVALHYCKTHLKINRKMENSTPCKIVTPENFILKLGTRDYVEDVTYTTQFLMQIALEGLLPEQVKYNPFVTFVLSCTLLFSGSNAQLEPQGRYSRFHATFQPL